MKKELFITLILCTVAIKGTAQTHSCELEDLNGTYQVVEESLDFFHSGVEFQHGVGSAVVHRSKFCPLGTMGAVRSAKLQPSGPGCRMSITVACGEGHPDKVVGYVSATDSTADTLFIELCNRLFCKKIPILQRTEL